MNNNNTKPGLTMSYWHTLHRKLAFQAYLALCNSHIIRHRPDLQQLNPNHELILNANMPFEYHVENDNSTGVLLIHGLLDCPFSLKEIAADLHKNNIYCRSILLPGHGTTPSELLTVTYHDWLHTANYGIESFPKNINNIFIIGYSTGAALAAYIALKNKNIAGIILISPCIQINALALRAMRSQAFIHRSLLKAPWLTKLPEIDYAKYQSIPLHGALEVYALTQQLEKLIEKEKLTCPLLIISSEQDETISTPAALNFFKLQTHKKNNFILYTPNAKNNAYSQIEERSASYPALRIKHFSHIALPFSSTNVHYGQQGDYSLASHLNEKEIQFGAYIPPEIILSQFLYRFKLSRFKKRELTYNPDYHYISLKILDFIKKA